MGTLTTLSNRVLGGVRRGLDRVMPPLTSGSVTDDEHDPSDETSAPVPSGTAAAKSPNGKDRDLTRALQLVAVVLLLLIPAGSIALGVVGDDAGGGPLPGGWAGAERIIVTTAADGRDGSLRDAVDRASASGGDTVIELEATTYRLTSGCSKSNQNGHVDENDNDAGDLNITGGGGLRITGNGATIVQECPGQRVLHVTGSQRVHLSGVTLAGGQATSPMGQGSGGALLSDGGADVRIEDSMLTSNTAQDNGGAVALTGPSSTLVLNRSVISGNSAGSSGGGVWVLGTLDATNTTITDNLAGTNGAVVATDVALTFSTVVDNSSTSSASGRQLGAANLTSFASYIAGGAGATASCSVERASSEGYNVGDDTSCGFGPGLGDLADGPRDGVGLLGYYGKSIPARPPARSSVLVDRVPANACRGRTVSDTNTNTDTDTEPEPDVDGQGRPRDDPSCDVGASEPPADLDVPLTATAARAATPIAGRATYTG